VHQRLAAGENNPLNAQFLDGGQLAREIVRMDLANSVSRPDGAHHATAVAAMRQDQGHLVGSSHSTPEVVIGVVRQVAKAIDGSLPAGVEAMKRRTQS